jgi:hypothetical protein
MKKNNISTQQNIKTIQQQIEEIMDQHRLGDLTRVKSVEALKDDIFWLVEREKSQFKKQLTMEIRNMLGFSVKQEKKIENRLLTA